MGSEDSDSGHHQVCTSRVDHPLDALHCFQQCHIYKVQEVTQANEHLSPLIPWTNLQHFWLLQATGSQLMQRHTCRQNTHTLKYSLSKQQTKQQKEFLRLKILRKRPNFITSLKDLYFASLVKTGSHT